MKQKFQIQELQTYNSQSNDNSNPNEISNTYIENPIEQLSIDNNFTQRKNRHFGNFRILYQRQAFFLTIGPDYVCFCIAYVLFSMMSFVVIYTAAVELQNFWVNLANIVFSIVQNLSYIVVALSNPGIQTKNTLVSEQQPSDQIKRFCKKCNVRMQKDTYHCRQCDLCIKKYDHHCPWTSKCIGQANLNKFYVFVTSTMTFILYSIIILLVCMAKNALQIQNQLKNKKTL